MVRLFEGHEEEDGRAMTRTSDYDVDDYATGAIA
jgi:hypothetical protein